MQQPTPSETSAVGQAIKVKEKPYKKGCIKYHQPPKSNFNSVLSNEHLSQSVNKFQSSNQPGTGK